MTKVKDKSKPSMNLLNLNEIIFLGMVKVGLVEDLLIEKGGFREIHKWAQNAADFLVKHSMIEDTEKSWFVLTDKGDAFLNAVESIPVPVAVTKWVIPTQGEVSK